MSQTRPNKMITITNDEVYDLATHQARLADSANVTVPVANQTERDSLPLYPGRAVWRQDLNALQVYNGAIWSVVNLGDTGWIAPTVFGNGFTAYNASGYDGVKYRLVGNTVHVSGAAQNGGTYGGGVAICALPAGYVPSRRIVGTNCVVDTAGNVLTTVSGGAAGVTTAVTFSAMYFLG